MGIVAEGIENEFEAAAMMKFGCTEMQGFYCAEPTTADEISKLLRTFQSKRMSRTPKPLRVVKTGSAVG